jgi:AcrR family transcriptional regulator
MASTSGTPRRRRRTQEERSATTRAALLDATREILETDGFDDLTMTAVAARAGVTRRAVYMHFPSRAELVDGLFQHVAETEGLAASVQRVWDAPDAVSALDVWARHLADYHPRLIAVTRAIERVVERDADAARHRQKVVRAQRASCRRLATWLERDDRLASPWTVDTAADMLWALISTDMIEALLVHRRWSRTRLGDHLSLLFRSTFTTTR